MMLFLHWISCAPAPTTNSELEGPGVKFPTRIEKQAGGTPTPAGNNKVCALLQALNGAPFRSDTPDTPVGPSMTQSAEQPMCVQEASRGEQHVQSGHMGQYTALMHMHVYLLAANSPAVCLHLRWLRCAVRTDSPWTLPTCAKKAQITIRLINGLLIWLDFIL